MITGFFLNLINTFLLFLIGLLPEGPDIPEGIATTLQTTVNYASKLNDILPVEEILIVFGLWVAVEVGLKVFQLTFWVFRVVRPH